MGKEIGNNGFTADDFVRFSQRLALETRHAQDAYAVAISPTPAWSQVSNSKPG
jgi:hypothetical protein